MHHEEPHFIFYRWGPINRGKLQEYLNKRKDLIIDTEHVEEEELFEWDFATNSKL